MNLTNEFEPDRLSHISRATAASPLRHVAVFAGPNPLSHGLTPKAEAVWTRLADNLRNDSLV